MKAIVFPGQGAQFTGMGKGLRGHNEETDRHLKIVDDIMGFPLIDIMENGTEEELRSTDITQPALFVHSLTKYFQAPDMNPSAFAGHSLGEFTALVAARSIGFVDGLELVKLRSQEMKKACDEVGGTMAAILGLEDEKVEEICHSIDGVVTPANYNCPGQLVISGELKSIERAIEACKEAGARRAVLLPVGGAFHSALMASASARLKEKIQAINFESPSYPIYQNVSGKAEENVETIKKNLIDQLTSPVLWTQTMKSMISDGLNSVTEVGGKGRILVGLFKRIDRTLEFQVV